MEAQAKRDLIARYRQQQLQTRKNEEYAALAHEIEAAEKIIASVEDRELDLMEELEKLTPQLATAEKLHADERSKLQNILDSLESKKPTWKRASANSKAIASDTRKGSTMKFSPLRASLQDQARHRPCHPRTRGLHGLPYESHGPNDRPSPRGKTNHPLSAVRPHPVYARINIGRESKISVDTQIRGITNAPLNTTVIVVITIIGNSNILGDIVLVPPYQEHANKENYLDPRRFWGGWECSAGSSGRDNRNQRNRRASPPPLPSWTGGMANMRRAIGWVFATPLRTTG